MKTKMIVMTVLAVAIGTGSLWFAPTNSRAAETNSAAVNHKVLYYTCPMHPSVREDKPGDCPICGMHLVPVYQTNNIANTNAPAITMTNSPEVKTNCAMTMPSCCGASCPMNPKP